MKTIDPRLLTNGTVVNTELTPQPDAEGSTMIVKLANPTKNDNDRYKIVKPEQDGYWVHDLKDWVEDNALRHRFDRGTEEWVTVASDTECDHREVTNHICDNCEEEVGKRA